RWNGGGRSAPFARPRPYSDRARMSGHVRRLAACLALVALAIAGGGKRGPRVGPELRAPQPVADLAGAVDEAAITLSWTPPTRRADNTRLRDFTVMRIFRAEDNGGGEARSAMLVDGRIAGYEEIAAIRGAEPEPAVRRGPRLVLTDTKALVYGRRYTYVILTGGQQGRIGPPSRRVSGMYAAGRADPDNAGADERQVAVHRAWT